MARTSQTRTAERLSQLIAETAKKPLHRARKKATAKKTTLNTKDSHATCSGRFDDVVIAYPGPAF
jgi:hypothetical protein